jgi:RNA polymerase sigma-70 factor, ECF subfamily
MGYPNRRQDHTLQSAALVHEAYLRMVGRNTVHWQDRIHFFAVASRMMRGILVDHARMRQAAKRGGNNTVTLTQDQGVNLIAGTEELDLLGLDEALTRLAALDHWSAWMRAMKLSIKWNSGPRKPANISKS